MGYGGIRGGIGGHGWSADSPKLIHYIVVDFKREPPNLRVGILKHVQNAHAMDVQTINNHIENKISKAYICPTAMAAFAEIHLQRLHCNRFCFDLVAKSDRNFVPVIRQARLDGISPLAAWLALSR